MKTSQAAVLLSLLFLIATTICIIKDYVLASIVPFLIAQGWLYISLICKAIERLEN